MDLFLPHTYYIVCVVMAVLAVVVFAALHLVTAGYGMMYNSKWGPAVNNRLGWVLMEAPSFIAMLLFWILSPRRDCAPQAVMASLFLLHYFQRSFIFPLLIRGNGRMPLAIIAMGVAFNLVNAYLIGGWLFFVAPEGYYDHWFADPRFWAGCVLFAFGMGVNLQSDYIVRHLRKPGDTSHYIPRGGMFRYVTSANYLGEFLEWCGYAMLTWSVGGAVFAVWTFANLAPRARRIHRRYIEEFGDEYRNLRRHYILPFIY